MGLKHVALFLFLSAPAVAQTISIPQITPGSRGDSAFMNGALAAAAAKGTADALSAMGKQGANGALHINVIPPQDLSYSAGGLGNGIIIGPGNTISYCPVLSCVTSPSADHQRTSALFWSTTQDDGHSEEQTVAIETIINKGAFKLWTASTAYAVGDILNQLGGNAVYRATQAGTSAASGTGPSGQAVSILDGTVTWQWVSDSAILGKVGLYSETQLLPGAGNAWDSAHNFMVMPGAMIPKAFLVNQELDFTNNSGTDCAAGVNSCVGLQLFMGGTNKSTAAIAIAPNGIIPNGIGAPALFGLLMNGGVASYSDLEVSSSGSQYGLSFNSFVGGAHTTASMIDASTSPTSILIQGSHGSQSIADTATTPAALNLAGTYSLSAIRTADATTAAVIVARSGQKICMSGVHACNWYDASAGKWYWTDENDVVVMSVARATGNLIVKGTVTQTGAP